MPQFLMMAFLLELTLPSLLPTFSTCLTMSNPSITSPKTTCFPLRRLSDFISSQEDMRWHSLQPVASVSKSDEKLRPIAIWSGIGHRKQSRFWAIS